MQAELELLEAWRDICSNIADFLGAHSGIAFDTAQATLTPPFLTDETESTVPKPTHTLVSWRRICLAFSQQPPVEIRIASPTGAVEDTSAGSLDIGLFRDPLVHKINRTMTEILHIKPQSSSNWGVDGAFGNEKLFAFHENKSTLAMMRQLCMNHRNHLKWSG